VVHHISHPPNSHVRGSRLCQTPTTRNSAAFALRGQNDVHPVKQKRKGTNMSVDKCCRRKLPALRNGLPRPYHDIGTRKKPLDQWNYRVMLLEVHHFGVEPQELRRPYPIHPVPNENHTRRSPLDHFPCPHNHSLHRPIGTFHCFVLPHGLHMHLWHRPIGMNHWFVLLHCFHANLWSFDPRGASLLVLIIVSLLLS
jgi:hypothetical protein